MRLFWAFTHTKKHFILSLLSPCIHDVRNRSEISIREIYNQLTCSFYGKAAILLAKHLSDRDLGPISNYCGHKALLIIYRRKIE